MEYRYNAEYIKEYCDNTDINIRNNFNPDVYIVIIGHLLRIDDLIYFYKGLKNVVFVVDDIEDENKVKLLRENNFNVIISTTPKETGFGNINLQCTSTMVGINYLKSININNMIRMRSDQIILQLHEFINNFKFDKIGFLSYIIPTIPHMTGGNDYINSLISSEHKLDVSKLSYNYVMDYCITGNVYELDKMFNYHETGKIAAPGEHKLLTQYMVSKNMVLDNSFENIKKNFYLILTTLTKYNIDFIMIKQDYTNWSVCLKQEAPHIYHF